MFNLNLRFNYFFIRLTRLVKCQVQAGYLEEKYV